MPWNIIDEGERYVIQCSGDEIAMLLPEEIHLTEDEETRKAIDEQFNKSHIIEIYVKKSDMVHF
jgi:hypothetical protein